MGDGIPAHVKVRAFAPGRVNLIGEHTDYNGGVCLPFAIGLGVTVSASLQAGSGVASPALRDNDPFLRGAVAELAGAGVGLSAALCVSLVLALYAAAGLGAPPPVELARLCSRIENDYAGARTGML